MTVKANRSNIERRFDSFVETNTGRGTDRDKLERMRPQSRRFMPQEARQWYLANGFLQTVVDAPAEDATREWITITTNRDNDDPDTGVEGLGINRLIEKRLEALNARERVKDLVRFSRMYNEGAFMYFLVNAEVPQTKFMLVEPMPSEINCIEALNVFGPDKVTFQEAAISPLSKYYHKLKYMVNGFSVHESRLFHMVKNYLPEERRGVSVIETVLDAVKAQDTALWSVTSIIFEMALWVFKSPEVKDMPPEKLAELVATMRAVISSQSAMAVGDDEDMQRIESNQNGNLKELFDFIFENLSGLSRMPKSRLMGQSQGVITSGQFDLMNYYDTVAKFQEIEVRFLIQKIIGLIVKEKDGDIYKALDGKVDGLDWEFEFKPLWRLGPKDQSEVDLRNAQTDQIYVTTAVKEPGEVRSERFKDLEDFDEWKEAPLDMKTPPVPPASPGDTLDNDDKKAGLGEPGKKQNAAV